MKKISLLSLAFLLCQVLIYGQVEAPRPMEWKDVSSWKSLSTFSTTISPDGQWSAYAIVTVEGDAELIVQKLNDPESKKSYDIGSTSFPSFSFSENSQWIAFKEYPSFQAQKANKKKKGTPLKDKLTLVKLGEEDKMTIENVRTFSFNGEGSSHLVIHLSPEKPNTKAKGSDLLLVHLDNKKQQNIGNVSAFSFNKSGSHLAYTVDAEGKKGNGLYLLQVAQNRTAILDNDEATYQSLNWTEEGNAFAALKFTEDKKYKQGLGEVIGVKNLMNPTLTVYNPQEDSVHLSDDYTISPNRRPQWSEDMTRLFYGIHLLTLTKPEEAQPELNQDSIKQAESEEIARLKSDTSITTVVELQKAIADLKKDKPSAANEDAKKPDMAIWHWKDSRLQSRQQVMERSDKNGSFWAMYHVADDKAMALQDSSMMNLSLLPKDKYALGSDIQKYEWDINLDGQNYRDYYIVNLSTGEKTKLFDKFYLPSFSANPRPSPDGTKLLYSLDGHYYVYDIPTGKSRNITEALPVSFVDEEDDHNVVKPMFPALDWSADSKLVFLRDGWDIWQVAADGSSDAVNLTQDGREKQIRYQYRFQLDPEEKGMDTQRPQYLRMYGEWTKQSGIARLDFNRRGLQAGTKKLVWEDANVNRLSKAKNADVYSFSKEKFNDPTDFFFASADLNNSVQFTENAPDADKFMWSEGVQLVDYTSDKGVKLQGALFLPAGYEEGKKYPTMIYYYEKLSQTLHNWSNPGFGGTGWNPSMYTSQGYAVFIPDIVYEMDDPGMSAVWCVLPAIDAALKTGVIDENRMGLHGHSWGGYQTAFLITQTNRFSAAAAGAPLTNMISMYDLIYWNSGGGNMSIFEASQGRFTGGPWENWDAYERNSPVYHVKNVQTPLLMLHNDKDGAVDFTQGIEYYSALRRLKKPVIMMQYKGENHGLSKMENRKDYSVRMMEFFDHHLKGKPAPVWLSNGIEHLKLGEHLEERIFRDK